jgi:hypothetical protein
MSRKTNATSPAAAPAGTAGARLVAWTALPVLVVAPTFVIAI